VSDSPPPTQLLWQVPFSAFVWGAGFGVMIGTSLVSVAAQRLRSPADQSLWSAKAFSKVLGVSRSNLRITYHPDFDPARPTVFCQNHVNVLDAHTACASIPQPFVGLMLAWHFKIPGYGWMMRATHGIPVHKGASNRTELLCAEARDRASKGLSILTFPEAHRTADGKVQPFKRGVFFMARDSGLPVASIAVRGMFEVNRKGSALFAPGDVDVYIGPQIETADLDDEGIMALAANLGEAMARYVDGTDPDGSGIAALG
jgi:1-acyl-sn-glycerol-3-phosphate acyltransferase